MDLLGRTIGNYVVRAKLGEGGMGQVYLCEHPQLGRRAALKVLHEELADQDEVVERFFHEAKAAAEIGHEHIVDVYDFGRIPGEGGGEIVYLLMEFLDGESLGHRMRHGGLAIDEVRHVMTQCCSALAASHAKGIVHRDLKPENIYLCPRQGDPNFVKVLDFGIAKLLAPSAQSFKTRAGVALGTPAYMSPEQCEAQGDIDQRSDIYSLGVVMYELVTGRVPFNAPSFGQILLAQMTQAPEPPSLARPGVPPAIEAIVLHAMEKDRARRFQSMEEFAEAIRDPDAHLGRYQPAPPPPVHSGHTRVLPAEPPPSAAAAPTMMSTLAAPTVAAATTGALIPPASRSVLAPALAGLFGVLAIAGIGGVAILLLRPRAPVCDVPPRPAVAAAPAVDWITVGVTSDPQGATVISPEHEDAVVGTTPLQLKVKRGDPTFALRVELAGRAPATRLVTTDASKQLLVVLEERPAPAHAAPAPPPPTAPRRRPLSNDDALRSPRF